MRVCHKGGQEGRMERVDGEGELRGWVLNWY